MNETTQTLKTDEQSEVSLSSKLAGKPAEEKDMITLKWGTLKAWDIKTEKAKELLKKYGELGMSFGAMQQHDTPEQKELICQMIDACNADEIYLDWDGKYVSKEKAKEYVLNYGKEQAKIQRSK